VGGESGVTCPSLRIQGRTKFLLPRDQVGQTAYFSRQATPGEPVLLLPGVVPTAPLEDRTPSNRPQQLALPAPASNGEPFSPGSGARLAAGVRNKAGTGSGAQAGAVSGAGAGAGAGPGAVSGAGAGAEARVGAGVGRQGQGTPSSTRPPFCNSRPPQHRPRCPPMLKLPTVNAGTAGSTRGSAAEAFSRAVSLGAKGVRGVPPKEVPPEGVPLALVTGAGGVPPAYQSLSLVRGHAQGYECAGTARGHLPVLPLPLPG